MSINRVRIRFNPLGRGRTRIEALMGPAVIYSRVTRAEFSMESVTEFLDCLQVANPEEVQGMVSKWVKREEKRMA